MEANWQARMEKLICDERMRPVMEGLAAGGCVDEGDDERMGQIEWDPEARLWLMERPDDSVPEPWRSLSIKLARQHSAVDRFNAAALFFDPKDVPIGFGYKSCCDARDLASGDFYLEVVQGAEALVRQGWDRHKYPELEYLRRKAERESGWHRTSGSDRAQRSSREAEFHKLYNRFERRFRYQGGKRRALRKQQHETTPRGTV